MSYQIKFTEDTNPAKPSITVEDQRLNTATSLTFVGKNYSGYAPVIAENFLHLLENFASPEIGVNVPASSSLNNPIQGQLWYNTSTNVLNVYDGTTWTAAGAVKKSGDTPAEALKGDLWIDTTNNQLYIYSGSTWLLVGPQFSSGVKTGPDVETIVDVDNVERHVVTFYSEDYRVAIISKETFVPKITINGFTTIRQGINLSSVDATSTTNPSKIWGVAEKADALIVGGATIPASNFLRKDEASTSNFPISIRNNSGLSIGNDLSFNIYKDSSTNSTVFYSKNSGNAIQIKLNNAGSVVTAIHVDSNGFVGVGPNNTNPTHELDVAGAIRTDGKIFVDDTTDTTGPGSEASISTQGGLSVNKGLQVGGDITSFGTLYLNNLTPEGDPTTGAVLLPGSDDATLLYDIGSSSRRFRNVWAQNFQGNFTGSFTAVGGTFNGSITGSAASLASATNFSMTGDVTSTNTITFDGQGDDPAVFNTVITSDHITSKPAVTDSLGSDQLLIYRSSVSGLRKITKQNFIGNIPTVPVGAIFPFAGITPPVGYVFCDGSELKISDYSALFAVIGYTYKTPSLLIGNATFALPDFRGRFALGRDDMDNNLTVPSKIDPAILIDAGGGSANSVTNVLADTLGGKGGSETTALELKNLPDHKHNLRTSTAQYYAAGLPGAGTDPNAEAGLGMPSSSTGSGLPNSGSVISSSYAQPFNTMNPYTTINYIIFTGATA